MNKKRIIALGIVVAVISVSGIVIFNNNKNEDDAVESVALIETDEDKEDKTVTTISPSEPIKEEEIKEEENEAVIEESTTETTNTADSDITPLDQIMYAQEEVNTRSGPSTDYEKVDSLSLNEEVHITGQSKSTGWYEIDLNGSKED